MFRLRHAAAAVLIGIATAIVILALAILPFLNPVWVGFAQGRAGASAATGLDTPELATVTGAILGDLVLGPPDFDVAVDGRPVLSERERGHMRDVRGVFAAFYLLAIAAAVVLVAGYVLAREGRRARLWRWISTSGRVLAVATVAGGIVGVVFFDAAFEVFHRLFFPAGTYLFDPRTERLVQLFPQQFWVETSIAVGIVVVGLSLAVWWIAGRLASGAARGAPDASADAARAMAAR